MLQQFLEVYETIASVEWKTMESLRTFVAPYEMLLKLVGVEPGVMMCNKMTVVQAGAVLHYVTILVERKLALMRGANRVL